MNDQLVVPLHAMFTSRMEAHTAERFDSEVPVWWERHAGPLLALALGITAASSASTAAFLCAPLAPGILEFAQQKKNLFQNSKIFGVREEGRCEHS